MRGTTRSNPVIADFLSDTRNVQTGDSLLDVTMKEREMMGSVTHTSVWVILNGYI